MIKHNISPTMFASLNVDVLLDVLQISKEEFFQRLDLRIDEHLEDEKKIQKVIDKFGKV